MKTTTVALRNSMNRWPLMVAFLFLPLVLAYFELSPSARAVSPAPDGGYPESTTAEGDGALQSLTTGKANTALGCQALFRNASGGLNTATGAFALHSNTDGSFNAADGFDALDANTTGSSNTASGSYALLKNTTGDSNTACGRYALSSNTIGGRNTAIGISALVRNSTGFNNIAVGSEAGVNLTTGNANIDIGNPGVAAESETIRIGSARQTKTFIGGIRGATVAGAAVFVNSSGQLGTAPSSARFKDEIKPMDKASEVILALKPVTFRYKHELDPDGIPQFGLVAEDVEKVNPDLVARDAKGKPYTVRYDAVNAMLLNEFLKEHRAFLAERRKVQRQEAAIAELKSGMKALIATGE
jgi:hypothetical protein